VKRRLGFGAGEGRLLEVDQAELGCFVGDGLQLGPEFLATSRRHTGAATILGEEDQSALMHESLRIRRVQSPIIPVIADLIQSNPGTISLGQGVVNYGPPPAALEQIKEEWPPVGTSNDLYFGGTAYDNRGGVGQQTKSLVEIDGQADVKWLEPPHPSHEPVRARKLNRHGTLIDHSVVYHVRLNEAAATPVKV